MRSQQAFLWILLLASNLAWGAYVVLRTAPEPAQESLAPPAATPSAAEAEASSADAPKASRAQPNAVAAARERLQTIKADILQIDDPARRNVGVAALEAALASDDPTLAAGALQSLHDLRDAAFDKAGLRPRVLARLGDANARVRTAALYALLQVPREEGDLARVLAILKSETPPSEAALHVATMLSEYRVEGRLAAAYVQALEQPDGATAIDVANLLRGMWVAPEVEEAVLATWRRTKDGPHAGLWNHILGQITPTREPRVRVIFEILRQDRTDAPQLLERALEQRSLEPDARRTAVDLALEGLGTAPNAMVRRLMLEVIEAHGQAADATRLRAFADNPMVSDELRTAARRVADGLR